MDFAVEQVILAGAFYPQYFVQVSHDEGRERDAVRELAGNDPRTTVRLNTATLESKLHHFYCYCKSVRVLLIKYAKYLITNGIITFSTKLKKTYLDTQE